MSKLEHLEPVVDLRQFLQPTSHFPPDLQFHVISPKHGTTTLLPAHRVFLAEASPVFRRQFYGGFFRPTEDTEVDIKDVEPDVFRQFLDLIYGGTDIQWTGSDKQELQNLFELLKLTDYHYHDGHDKPIAILKGRVLKVFNEMNIVDCDLDDYIEIADKYSFLEDAYKVVIDKAFKSKCLQQLCTVEFDNTIVGIARDKNPRSRPKPLALLSLEERQGLARSLPQTTALLPSKLTRFQKPILKVTQHIQAEKDKHTTVKKVVEVEEDDLMKEELAVPSSSNSPAKIDKWSVVDGKWKITPAFTEMMERAKEERDKAEVAHRSSATSVLKGSTNRSVQEQPVVQCPGRLGPLVHFSVLTKPETARDQYDAVADMMKRDFAGQRGAIFTTTKKQADTLVTELRKREVSAGMGSDITRQGMLDWLGGKIQVIVACSFSFGRFKVSNQVLFNRVATTAVSFVVHFSLPFSMKDFFRDISLLSEDIRTKSIVFWRLADYINLSQMLSGDQQTSATLHSLVSFCLEVETCRKVLLARHLCQPAQQICGNLCDNCQVGQGTDVTDHAKEVLRVLRAAKQKDIKVTGKQLVDCLMGNGLPTLKLEGWEGSSLAREQVEVVVAKLIVDKFVWEHLVTNIHRTQGYIEAADRDIIDTVRMKFREVNIIKRVRQDKGITKTEPKSKKVKHEDVDDDDMDFM
eukprot:GFUD01024792.1.p1 GENE.GFUD01024792.1~~GFUD01024792.1.p1  ORF type:complete len:707 (-),score=192.54 GFUD01024792.1:145-2214(-)